MSSQMSGILHFYPDEKISSTCSTFTLQEGETIIGSSLLCDITLNYPDISSEHCKITITEEDDYSIEDLGSKHGVFRASGKQSRQQLKVGKEYELSSGKEFYLANRYKCVFKAVISEEKRVIANNNVQKPYVKPFEEDEEEEPIFVFPDDDISYTSEEDRDMPAQPLNNQKISQIQVQERNDVNSNKFMINNQQVSEKTDIKIPERNNSRGNGNGSNRLKYQDKENKNGHSMVSNVKNPNSKNINRNSQLSSQMSEREKQKQVAKTGLHKRKEDIDENTDEESVESEFEIEEDDDEEGPKTRKFDEEKLDEEKREIQDSEEDTDKEDSEDEPPKIMSSAQVKVRNISQRNTGKDKEEIKQEESEEDTDKEDSDDEPEKIASSSQIKQGKLPERKANKNVTAKNTRNNGVETEEIEIPETPRRRGRSALNQPEDNGKSLNTKRLGGEDDLLEFEEASTHWKKFQSDDKRLVRSPFKFLLPMKTPRNSSITKGSPTSSEASSPKLSPIHKKKTENKMVVEDDETSNDSSEEETLLGRNAFQVMFSGFEKRGFGADDDKRRLANLGAKVVEDKEKNFTVLVMDKFKRTIKLLLAISRGIDVVNYNWVKDSIKKGRIQPPQDYVFTDKTAESKFKFKLSHSLEKARNQKKGLLEGYRVYLPQNIVPSFGEMSRLVESTGGLIRKTKPSSFEEDTLVIVDIDDVKNTNHFRGLGFDVYTSELIFSAILRQKLNLNENRV